MAATPPARFDVQPGDDLGRIALAAVINKKAEQADNIGRVDWLYASTNRRSLLNRVFLPPITNTTTSGRLLNDTYCRLSTSRQNITITTLADDAQITVTVYRYSTGAVLGTVTITHASGGATVQTGAITGITATDVFIRTQVRADTTTATWQTITIIEDSLTTLP